MEQLNEEYIMAGTNQARLIATIWRDEKLFLMAKNCGLRPTDFSMQAGEMIYETMRDYREKYGKMPSMATLQDLVADKLKEEGGENENLVKEACWTLGIMSDDTVLDYTYACDKLVKFIRSSRISQAVVANPNDTERISEVVNEVDNLVKSPTRKPQVRPLKNFRDLLPQTEGDLDVKIPTGIPFLDVITGGGLNASLNEIGLGMAGTGVGKALPNDDPIPTPDGWKKVGDIREGDFLFGADGKPVKVLKTWPQPEKKKVWVVEFTDGRKIRCCGEHNWEYWFEGHDGRNSQVATTKEIFEHAAKRGGFRNHGGRGYRFRIKMCEPAEFRKTNLPVDPYIVGAAIGNGCLSQWQFAISSSTSEVPNKIAGLLGVKAIKTSGKNYSWIFETKDGHHLQNKEVFVGSCKNYLLGKLSHEKSIPPEYLTASTQDRFNLLSGLLDTDGGISKTGGRISYSTTSRQLAEDIVVLCNSLGMTAVPKAEGRTDYKSGVCYNIRIQCKKRFKLKLFSVSDKKRKAVEYVNNGKREERKTFLSISNIKETDELADMTCFTVDAKDGLFLCNHYVVTHNTNMMINFAISAMFAGFKVLFITLELTEKEISRRMFAMAAHIKTKEIKTPLERWSPESVERMEYLSNSSINDNFAIADLSDRSHTVSDLVGEIETWKKETKAACGTDEKCKLVIIDWIDMLVPEAKDAKMLQQQWQALEKVGKDLKHMVNNQNVALWCVSQTNRSGAGTQKVRLDHISGSFSKNFFASIALGLAPVNEDEEDREINQNMSEAEMQKMNIECNRELHLSILKNRDGVQREADIYQGPTLRFWQSKSMWRTTERILATRDMKKIFGDGIK